MEKRTKFVELKKVFDRLHGPDGCLWDKKQTHKSILPDLKEEADEFIAAVKKGDLHNMREELGDILLHVMFHAKLAEKAGNFDVEDVIDELIRKLKRRHPHVFGKEKVTSAEQIIENWEKIKAREKEERKKKHAGGTKR
jgi:tetrapyrrole methylase family protein/MazG family protein